MEDLGKALFVAGLAIAVLGAVLLFSGKIPFVGGLPGDVSFGRRGFSVHLLFGTSLLLSLVVSLVLWLLRR